MENETDFRWQVSQNPELGGDIAKKLNFDSIRLICLAGDFNRYDLRSWKSHKSVELVTYRYFDNNTLLLEWKEGGGSHQTSEREPSRTSLPKHSTPAPSLSQQSAPIVKNPKRTLRYWLSLCDSSTLALYNEISQGIADFGIDINQYETSRLNNFKRRQLFACLRPVPTENKVYIWVRLDPKQEKIISGFTRDMSNIKSDASTCNLEIAVSKQQQVKKALKLCRKAYRQQVRDSSGSTKSYTQTNKQKKSGNHSVGEALAKSNKDLLALFKEFEKELAGLGSDVSSKETKLLRQFSRGQKIFVCIRPLPQSGKVLALVGLNPEREELIEGFSRDVSGIGGWGPRHCGLELKISRQSLPQSIQLCRRAYAEARS